MGEVQIVSTLTDTIVLFRPFIESTLVLRSPQPPMTGMATFQKLCATLEKVVRKWELS